MSVTVGCRWPDGRVTKADSFEELEQYIRENQWTKHADHKIFRDEMADRAMIWTGVEIDVDGESKDFLMELERAGMLILIPFGDVPDQADPFVPYSESQAWKRMAEEDRWIAGKEPEFEQ